MCYIFRVENFIFFLSGDRIKNLLSPFMITVKGNILDSTATYIVHQTNCVTRGGAKGLAKARFDKFPYANAYLTKNQARKPGTIELYGDNKTQRYVINLNGQCRPGPCQFADVSETPKQRLKWLESTLGSILSLVQPGETVAFPE